MFATPFGSESGWSGHCLMCVGGQAVARSRLDSRARDK